MMVIETGLDARVEEIETKTRMLDNPYHAINPSGRVPCLVRDDGVALEESEHICAYLDHVAGTSIWAVPDDDEGWELRRLTALARSLSDGVSVWLREKLRPDADRSAMIMEYERHRAGRLVAAWEHEIDAPLMQGPINRAQITLACALGLETSLPEASGGTKIQSLTRG